MCWLKRNPFLRGQRVRRLYHSTWSFNVSFFLHYHLLVSSGAWEEKVWTRNTSKKGCRQRNRNCRHGSNARSQALGNLATTPSMIEGTTASVTYWKSSSSGKQTPIGLSFSKWETRCSESKMVHSANVLLMAVQSRRKDSKRSRGLLTAWNTSSKSKLPGKRRRQRCEANSQLLFSWASVFVNNRSTRTTRTKHHDLTRNVVSVTSCNFTLCDARGSSFGLGLVEALEPTCENCRFTSRAHDSATKLFSFSQPGFFLALPSGPRPFLPVGAQGLRPLRRLCVANAFSPPA